MTDLQSNKTIHYKNGQCSNYEQQLIVEEPLSIRIDGKPYSVVMRTPGNEVEHTAGFCLAEGIVDQPDDIVTIGFCTDEGTNVSTVTLTENRQQKIAGLLERKGFVSQTSCGICGKEVINDLRQIISPVKNTFQVTVDQAVNCAEMLPSFQQLYQQTHSTHAAMIFNESLEKLSFAEDVGRHNALDKVIGKVFMDNKLSEAVIGIMSSRLSYELVQKAARAQLQVLIGISRPTALAVSLAKSINMSIACAKDNGLMIFCGEERFILY